MKNSRPQSRPELNAPTHPIAACTIDSNFDDRFIAFAENRLQTWTDNQDPSALVNLTDLSKAVNLFQRLQKMRQQPSSSDCSKNTMNHSSHPASALPIQSTQSAAHVQASPTPSTAPSHTPSPPQPHSPATHLSTDPMLPDLDQLLKEAKIMLREMQSGKKHHAANHHQPLPLPPSSTYRQPQTQPPSLVESLVQSSAQKRKDAAA